MSPIDIVRRGFELEGRNLHAYLQSFHTGTSAIPAYCWEAFARMWIKRYPELG